MLNPFHDVNWRPGPVERRKFAVSLMIGFPCVALALLLLGRWTGGAWHIRSALSVGAGGLGLGLVFFAWPAIVRPFYVAWYAVACCVGFVLGNVLLAVVFYLCFTGVGLALRILGRPPLRKGPDKRATTYWQDAKPPDSAEQYYRQF